MAAPARSTARCPGTFWINLRTTDLHSKYSLPDLAAHEAIPGHIWQGEYANKMPLIRAMLPFNAYSEGWALYAEQLVDELGVYDGFPAGRLGYFQSIAFRCLPAGRRQRPPRQALDPPAGGRFLRRDERFQPARGGERSGPLLQLARPSLRLQGRAQHHRPAARQVKAELGPKYDLRAFDDAVVLGGNVPMDVLAKNVDEYIARTKAAWTLLLAAARRPSCAGLGLKTLVEDRRTRFGPMRSFVVIARRSRLRPAAINAATARGC